MRTWLSSLGWFAGVGLLLPWGCGASGDGGSATLTTIANTEPGGGASGTAGSGASGAPSPGTEGPPSFGSGDFTGFETGEPATPGMGCQQASRSFVPNIPTVFILVDRSYSMFDPLPGSNTNAWAALRSGVLQVISDLQAEVRFGFAAFSGQAPDNCPNIPTEPPDLNNHAKISALYGSLERSPYKDTPTLAALSAAAETLWSDTVEGDKYILFVTDGEPDYCDDGNPLCPPDSVVGRLQRLAAGLDDTGAQQAPIHTLVFGVDSPLSTISPAVLQGFANAGAGQPVAPLTADPNAVYDQCNGVPGWAADFATTGKPAVRGQTVGTYAAADPVAGTPAAAGTATVYRPDPNDQAALIGQIRAALAGVKSCAFDLAGDGVQVDLTRTDLGELAKVIINGTPVPFDPVNGWRMLSEATVQLEGEACAAWRAPGETSIDFDFPCDVIILR